MGSSQSKAKKTSKNGTAGKQHKAAEKATTNHENTNKSEVKVIVTAERTSPKREEKVGRNSESVNQNASKDVKDNHEGAKKKFAQAVHLFSQALAEFPVFKKLEALSKRSWP